MSKIIEIEKKFFCKNNDKLIKKILEEGLILESDDIEIDEYFTDIDSNFIKNRTCLRIRKTNNSKMELTFKGKSKKFNNLYAKKESNIKLDIDEYEETVDFLASLGYYSYVKIEKERKTYSKKSNLIKFNIMVDIIKGVGDFVEFEIIYPDEYGNIELLKNKLLDFIEQFNELEFEEAHLPYRDFCAQKIYNDIISKEKLKCLIVDLDGTLINSEIEFFESYKKTLLNLYNVEISLEEYFENELNKNANLIRYLKQNKKINEKEEENTIMNHIYLEYEKKFESLLEKEEVFSNFELLKKLKSLGLKVALATTSKREFVNLLLNKLNINDLFDIILAREDVNELKPSGEIYKKILEKLNLNENEVIAIEDSKRGIDAAKANNIKVICVNRYSLKKEKIKNVITYDSFIRIGLILNNIYK